MIGGSLSFLYRLMETAPLWLSSFSFQSILISVVRQQCMYDWSDLHEALDDFLCRRWWVPLRVLVYGLRWYKYDELA